MVTHMWSHLLLAFCSVFFVVYVLLQLSHIRPLQKRVKALEKDFATLPPRRRRDSLGRYAK